MQLNGAGLLYMIQAGRCEIYALVGGRRVYLTEFGVGQTLVCSPSVHGQLIAIAPDGGVIVALALASLAHDAQAMVLDAWIIALSEAATRHGSARPSLRAIDGGDLLQGIRGQNLHTLRGVLWAGRIGTAMRFLGSVPTEQAVPITHATWVEIDTDANVATIDTRTLIDAGAFPDAMAVFCNLLLAFLAMQLNQQVQAEAERIAGREHQLALDVAAVIEGHEKILETKLPPPQDDAILYAYRKIGSEPPRGMHTSDQVDFPAFADAMHLPYRRVSLQGAWWSTDMGPLICQQRADASTVALLPDWRGRYRLHRQGAKPQVVDAALASTLDASAISVIKPLPERELRARDLLLVAIAACHADLGTLMIASFGASLLGLLVPLATGHIIDIFVPSGMRSQIVMLGVMLGVAQVCAFLLKASSDLARQRIDGRVAARLQGGIIDRVFRLPAIVLRRFSSTDMAMRAMSVDGIRRTVTGIALNSLLSGIFGLSSIGLLFYYDVYASLVALGLFAVLAALGLLAGLKQVNSMLKGEQMSANVATFTQQLMENISTLRAFGAEKRAYVEWSRNTIEMRKRGLRGKRVGILFDTMLAGYDLLAMALVFIVLGRETEAMSSGSFLAFASAYSGFLGASIAFGRAMLQVAALIPMFARVKPLIESQPEMSGAAKNPGRLSGALEVANVAFAYPDAKNVLNNISFRIEPGQFVALVGASGCGKSTLINLILGVDRPSQGAILFGGQNLNELDLTAVRRQFGVCRQNGRLFSGTLFDNILGAHAGTQAEVWEAARLAGIDQEIRALPMQLHTVITEGNSTFSGGQIQRLLLARALIGNPSIVVLDEATSALDNITQDLIVKNVERLGVTRIVVAHRLSTVRNADMILFIRDGHVVEAGSYDALLAQGRDFAQFVRRQSL